jgi:ABC-type branched-subunit amino acid transport system ATPase component
MNALLELQGVSKFFGGLQAVNNVSMRVMPGSIHALIGPNGAGKTTTFNLINGLLRLSSGRVIFKGIDVTNLAVHRRASCGIARTFQTPRLFDKMSVLETVMCGCHLSGRLGPFGSMFAFGRKRDEEHAILERAEHILVRVGIAELAEDTSGNLPYGYRRLLEVARALATSPNLLLLDEVAAGLNPTETARMADLVRSLAAEGIAVLLVEHDMTFVMGISHEITVLNFGGVLAEGSPSEVEANRAVIDAYLGAWEDESDRDSHAHRPSAS